MRCDLSRGIVTDDRAGTVTFRLTVSDPEFLFKLALPFAFVLPRGAAPQGPATRPLPATGPYRVATAAPGSLRLVRNPHFQEWSSAAQPAGFADEILITSVSKATRRVRLVLEGKADLATAQPEEPLRVPLGRRAQLHVRPTQVTHYLALAATRPPFHDVRARRALNFAVDRASVVRLAGGSDGSKPTCQLLPPNFPGYAPYCPYTLGADARSGWRAPDPAEARRLIRASGTAGAHVAVWWHRSLGVQAGRYLEQLLDSLGYRARLRLFSGDVGAYFGAVLRPGAPWNIAGSGWIGDYPSPAQFIELVSCAHAFNLGRFCDREIDARIRSARRLQERDPSAALEAWAALDRAVTDKAPWVSLYTPYAGDFVSRRVGNYQHHPTWGALLGQIWVR